MSVNTKKIWFLSRSYLPSVTGGTLIRKAQVELFNKAGFEVVVVTPNYGASIIEEAKGLVRIPMSNKLRIPLLFERTGLNEDYLDLWVKRAFRYLDKAVDKNDIVFATSGGELGSIKLGSLLKNKKDCKFVVNLHDPINYTLVNGLKIRDIIHVTRDRVEKKYLSNSDLIITSSVFNQNSLQNKYPKMKDKIVNSYFGYINEVNLSEKTTSNKLRIIYAGQFLAVQAPEILAHAIENLENIDVYFIGNYEKYEPLYKFADKVNFLPFMEHSKFLEFTMKNIDAGFVSLSDDYFGACVPSKIYEYINLGIPILGALPDGDAKDIINNNCYGLTCSYSDVKSLRNNIVELQKNKVLNKCRTSVLKDRSQWSMESRTRAVIEKLYSL
jgi:glycosyltransferase involved in cell wall biosynthesis